MVFDSPGLRIVDLPTRKVALKGGVSQRSEVLSVPESARDDAPWRCLFCRMRTGVRLFRMPVCTICRDQVQDFVWVSLVLVALVPTGFISGAQFVVEELLLFGVLVLVKHRLPSIFDRFTQSA